MQKHVNLVDLVKSFPTNIYLQNLASMQKRTSPVKFAHLAEKSGKCSISNLSTKDEAADGGDLPEREGLPLGAHVGVHEGLDGRVDIRWRLRWEHESERDGLTRSSGLFWGNW